MEALTPSGTVTDGSADPEQVVEPLPEMPVEAPKAPRSRRRRPRKPPGAAESVAEAAIQDELPAAGEASAPEEPESPGDTAAGVGPVGLAPPDSESASPAEAGTPEADAGIAPAADPQPDSDGDAPVPGDDAPSDEPGESADPQAPTVSFPALVTASDDPDEDADAGEASEGDDAVSLESLATDMPGTEVTTRQVIEAILFVSDAPLALSKIVSILGIGSAREVRKHIEALNKRYTKEGAVFRIEKLAGGYQMLTLPQYNTWLRRLRQTRQDSKLSPAAMETLAVVAYKQPVVRAEIEAIRGVSAGEMLNRLRELGLVKIVGRAEDVGRPMLYGTTKRFLEVFGLSGLEDLPQVEQLPPPQ